MMRRIPRNLPRAAIQRGDWSHPLHLLKLRMRRIFVILLWDPLALTELASGFLLVAGRGALLKWGPTLDMPQDVSGLLTAVGIDEARWGTYLMACGLIQICVAGSRHIRWRIGVTAAILIGFVTMAAAFIVTQDGMAAHHSGRYIVPSLICMSAFYTFILARVFHDRDRANGKVPGSG